MKIRIICIGKTKERYLSEGINEYLKRLSNVEYLEMKESEIKREEQKIIDMKNNYDLIILDEKGREYSSIEFADKIKRLQNNTLFIIGGPEGLSDNIKQNAKEIISLSRMTFTHEMARLFFIEQLYRSFQIIKGTGYHK